MRDWRRARDVATGVATCTGESFVAICIIWASLFKPRAVGVAPEVAPVEGAKEKDAVDKKAEAGLVVGAVVREIVEALFVTVDSKVKESEVVGSGVKESGMEDPGEVGMGLGEETEPSSQLEAVGSPLVSEEVVVAVVKEGDKGNESGHGVDSGTEEKDEGEGGGAGEGSNLLASEGGGATLNPDTIDAQWSLGLSRRAIPRLLQQLTTMFVITVTLVLVWEGVKGVWMLVGSKRVLMLAGATQDSTATLADSHGLHAEQKLYKSQGSHGPSIPSAVGGRLKAENHMIFLVLP